MPRVSRACEACKKRRIGCDLGEPSCNNCLQAGRICSGPVRGALIVNQTRSVVSRSQRGRTSGVTPSNRSASSSEIAILPSQPSSRAANSIAFTGQFFNFISDQSQKPSKESWIVQAHISGARRDPASAALGLSIQATSLAYCGAVTKHQPAIREAYSMYGMALQRLFKALSQGHYGSSSSSISGLSPSSRSLQLAAIVCTSVILSVFEAIYPTTTTAYATHLAAAWRIVGLLQEENWLGVSVIEQVATHLQFQTLFVMVAYPVQYKTAASEARRWNALGRSRYHQTADVSARFMIDLFDLADYFATDSCDRDYSGLTKRDPDIGKRLESLWEEYKEEAGSAGARLEWTLENDEPCYRDAYTAFIVAYFSVSHLLLAVLRMESESKVTEPCENILRCSAFLATRKIGCACLRMFFPLTLVARLSTSPRQRGAAYRYLSGWLQEATFMGLSTVAIKSVNPIAPTE